MSGIKKIDNNQDLSRQNLKKVLGYAVKRRRGNISSIASLDDKKGKTVEQLRSAGLIKAGHTLKSEIYQITDFGDKYYKNAFGLISYYRKKFIGKLNEALDGICYRGNG